MAIPVRRYPLCYVFLLSGLSCFIAYYCLSLLIWHDLRSVRMRNSRRSAASAGVSTEWTSCFSLFVLYLHWNGMGMEWEWNRLGWINHKGDGWLAGWMEQDLVDACIHSKRKPGLAWLGSYPLPVFSILFFRSLLSVLLSRSVPSGLTMTCCETGLSIYLYYLFTSILF